MRILTRYVLRQLVAPFLFAATALTALMLLDVVAKRFGALVGKGLGWRIVPISSRVPSTMARNALGRASMT